jgi:hypothetical protein
MSASEGLADPESFVGTFVGTFRTQAIKLTMSVVGVKWTSSSARPSPIFTQRGRLLKLLYV